MTASYRVSRKSPRSIGWYTLRVFPDCPLRRSRIKISLLLPGPRHWGILMAINTYTTCAECRGIGVLAFRPREEWTPNMEDSFKICPSCHGLDRVKESALA